MIIVNSGQYKQFLADNPDFQRGETLSEKPSKTVPGQVEDIATLVARFIRGDRMDVFPASFDPDEQVPPGIENLDKIERAEMAMETRNIVKDTRERMQARQRRAASPSPTLPEPKPDDTSPDQPTP